MNSTPTSSIPWRDEANHFMLLEDENLVVYGMISSTNSEWCSLQNDTISLALSDGNLQVESERNTFDEVQLHAGDVRSWEVGNRFIAQRFSANCSVMACVNIENRGGPCLNKEYKRSVLKGHNIHPVKEDESFSTISRGTVPSHGRLTLTRSEGVAPYCTMIIAQDRNVDLSGLVQVTNYETVTAATELRHGVSVSAIIVFNSDVQDDKTCIIMSNANIDLNLYIVDCWTVAKKVDKIVSSPTSPIPWREERLHSPVVEAPGATVYCSVSTSSGDWHSHSHDTIYFVLSSASALNELAGESPRPIELHKGTSFNYNLRGKAPLIHRVTDAHGILSFVGIEVRADVIPNNGKRATLKENIGKVLNAASDFATAFSISIPPGETLILARKPGIMPPRSVLVPLTDGRPITALKLEQVKSARHVLQLNYRFYIAVTVIENSVPSSENQESYCQLSNLSSETWTGAMIDVWTI